MAHDDMGNGVLDWDLVDVSGVSLCKARLSPNLLKFNITRTVCSRMRTQKFNQVKGQDRWEAARFRGFRGSDEGGVVYVLEFIFCTYYIRLTPS